MEISVHLEPTAARGYRATSLAPTHIVAEGPTREEALEQLLKLVRGQFAHGELVKVSVSVPAEPHPWRAFFGKLKNHPDAAEVEENIREYRRQVNSDPDRL